MVAALAVSTACAPITAAEVRRDVDHAVHVGMPVSEAYAALDRIGFQCLSSSNDPNDVRRDCFRQGGSGNLLSGCVQRFPMLVNKRAQVVGRLGPAFVACAGM